MEIQTKDELLEQISLAVEQVQKQFVQGGNVIKDCQETFFLCQCVENILHHGLKEGLISWAVEPTIWPLLEKITCSKDIEEIKMLRLKTDKEKCSVWIKMAVNENLLGSYITTINQDHSLLSNHYYEYAFLRDPVMADTVKSILNYGIANFDFQITISQNHPSNQFDITAKQERPISYDSIEQAKPKENGYVSPKTELGLTTTPETWSKKKRKKKKPSVKNVVIEEQNEYDGFDETIRTVNLDIVKESSEENKKDILKKEEKCTQIHEEDKLLRNTDDTQCSNKAELSLATTGQSGDSTVSDVRTNSLDSSSNAHVTDTASDSKAHRTDDQSDGLDESNNQRTVFVSSELDQYLTLNSQQNSESKENKERNKELDSLGRIIERASPRQEFSANDFLLDETQPRSNLIHSKVNITTVLQDASNLNTKDSSIESKTDNTSAIEGNSDFMNVEKSCKISDSGAENANSQKSENASESLRNNKELSGTNEEFTEISSNSKNENSSSPKTQRYPPGNSSDNKDDSDENEELSETPTNDKYSSNSHNSKTQGTAGSNKEQNESNEEFSEILSSGNSYDYRVRKVENPEFVSSSYGSSSVLSDFTDDDRDLNFIPGIHRISSKSFSSSFERKSTADSSVSFDENGFPMFESSHYTESLTSQPSSTDDGSSSRFADISNEWDLFEDLLNVEEGHFSNPDNFAGLTTSEELEIAIEHYKKMIKMRKEKSQQRDDLVQKLVKLRLRLQQEREGPPVENPQFRKILSHQFNKTEGSSGTKYFCDQCGKNIWTMWQSLFTCNDCGYHSHRKCLEHIQRPCPNKNLSTVSYILDICPDTGLDAQQYRCTECRKEIAFSKDDVAEARICDYTGQYFCDSCHWNDQVIIPARVLRNWDFTQHKVCRKTKQLLELMKTRPIVNIQEINPMLYRYVEELREVGKFREDILTMKKYFLTCRDALESKLLIQLQKRQHFVDSAHTYSFQDLLDLNNDALLPEVSKVHALFLAHIKADCELCRARGFICEVCRDSSDIIFAFDPHVVKCTNCSGVFHKICFKADDCPKCQRRKKVAEQT